MSRLQRYSCHSTVLYADCALWGTSILLVWYPKQMKLRLEMQMCYLLSISHPVVTTLNETPFLSLPSEFTMTNEEPLPKKVCLKILLWHSFPPTPHFYDSLINCASPFAPQVRLSEADFKVLPRDELILRYSDRVLLLQCFSKLLKMSPPTAIVFNALVLETHLAFLWYIFCKIFIVWNVFIYSLGGSTFCRKKILSSIF